MLLILMTFKTSFLNMTSLTINHYLFWQEGLILSSIKKKIMRRNLAFLHLEAFLTHLSEIMN